MSCYTTEPVPRQFKPFYSLKKRVSNLSQICLMFAICLQKLGFINSCAQWMNPKIGDTWDWTLDTILGAFSDLNFNDIVMQLCEYTNIFVRPSSWQTSLSVHGMNGMNWNEHLDLSKRIRNDPERPGIRSNWYWLYSSDLIDMWSWKKS